jgi:hypothetical protein
MSAKFYRLYDVNTNFLKLNINGLRHIITPTVSYTFSKSSDMPSNSLRIGGSSSTTSSAAVLGLSNKLQTKRDNQKVDLVDLRVSNTYNFKTGGSNKNGGNLSDFLIELDMLPYSWLRINSDATYHHQDSYFSDYNYDINFDFAKDRSIGIGQRFQRKGSNEIAYSFIWRLNPKWKFSLYQRYERGHDPSLSRGLSEQEYVISRDLHCWIMDVSYNVAQNRGATFWLIFRLKAFPELELNFNQSYHAPKPGSQSQSQ